MLLEISQGNLLDAVK